MALKLCLSDAGLGDTVEQFTAEPDRYKENEYARGLVEWKS